MTIARERYALYAVTDRVRAHTAEELLAQAAAVIRGGAQIVQLREKELPFGEFFEEARQFVALCRELGAVSIINDNVEIARLTGADGVHVGQEDMAAARAREILGPGKLVGVSAHTVEEARAAYEMGADYLGTGAAFVTGTKTDAKPITKETIRAITAAVDIPVVAIGGISAATCRSWPGSAWPARPWPPPSSPRTTRRPPPASCCPSAGASERRMDTGLS